MWLPRRPAAAAAVHVGRIGGAWVEDARGVGEMAGVNERERVDVPLQPVRLCAQPVAREALGSEELVRKREEEWAVRWQVQIDVAKVAGTILPAMKAGQAGAISIKRAKFSICQPTGDDFSEAIFVLKNG